MLIGICRGGSCAGGGGAVEADRILKFSSLQVLGLDVHNVSRAVYSLILNNLPFLYILFNISSTIDQLANIIHKSLIQYTDIDPDTDIDSGFMRVIQSVLVSDSYNQMKSLHISLLNCTMKHLSILWPKRWVTLLKSHIHLFL